MKLSHCEALKIRPDVFKSRNEAHGSSAFIIAWKKRKEMVVLQYQSKIVTTCIPAYQEG